MIMLSTLHLRMDKLLADKLRASAPKGRKLAGFVQVICAVNN